MRLKVAKLGKQHKPIHLIVILAALFPYLKTSPAGADIQPHFFLLFFVALIYQSFPMGKLPVSPTAGAFALFSGTIALVLGGGFTTLGIVTLPLAISYFRRVPRRTLLLGMKIAVIVYFIGIGLELVSDNIVQTLTSNYRTSRSRGLNSFASEPSYLGLIGLILTIGFVAFEEKRIWVALGIGLALCAQSLTAIVPLALLLVVANFGWRNVHWLLLILIAIYAFGYVIIQTDTRLGSLVSLLLYSPELLLSDVSFLNRLGRGISPLVEAWNSGFVPHRFPSEGDIAIAFEANDIRVDDSIARLSSLATVMAYVFGFLSIPVIVLYFYVSRPKLFLTIAVVFIACVNISISTPYLFLLLAFPLCVRRREIKSAIMHADLLPPHAISTPLPK